MKILRSLNIPAQIGFLHASFLCFVSMLLFTTAWNGSCFGKIFECGIQSGSIFKAVALGFFCLFVCLFLFFNSFIPLLM